MFSKVVITLFVSLFCAQVIAEKCGPCNRLDCPIMTFCPSGVAQDTCGCCQVCAQRLGETCDAGARETPQPGNGTCGEFLACSPLGVCECEEEGSVCGSDDTTYANLCLLMEATLANNDLTLLERAPCRVGPVIKSPPKDSARPAGSILVLDCEAVGFPVPAITWELYRPDGSTVQLPSDDSLVAVQVRGGPEKHMVTGWVQIMKVLPESVGIYTCIASNTQGEVKASAKVTFSKGKIPKKY